MRLEDFAITATVEDWTGIIGQVLEGDRIPFVIATEFDYELPVERLEAIDRRLAALDTKRYRELFQCALVDRYLHEAAINTNEAHQVVLLNTMADVELEYGDQERLYTSFMTAQSRGWSNSMVARLRLHTLARLRRPRYRDDLPGMLSQSINLMDPGFFRQALDYALRRCKEWSMVEAFLDEFIKVYTEHSLNNLATEKRREYVEVLAEQMEVYSVRQKSMERFFLFWHSHWYKGEGSALQELKRNLAAVLRGSRYFMEKLYAKDLYARGLLISLTQENETKPPPVPDVCDLLEHRNYSDVFKDMLLGYQRHYRYRFTTVKVGEVKKAIELIVVNPESAVPTPVDPGDDYALDMMNTWSHIRGVAPPENTVRMTIVDSRMEEIVMDTFSEYRAAIY